MFKKLVCVSYAQWRTYRSTGRNPGINRRLKIFKQENPEVEKIPLRESDFDDMEMDVMNSGRLKDDYQREYNKISKRIEFQKIERQFFDKKKNPNFLLWSEKEQIRDLHNSQPDEWTFQKLSESFPATPDIIKKVVKSQWKIKDVTFVRKHDEKVVSNWKSFQEEKLDLGPRLAEHLGKFTSRDRLVLPKESSSLIPCDEIKPEDKFPKTKSTEFVDIIRSYNKADNNDPAVEDVQMNNVLLPSKPAETYVLRGSERQFSKTKLYTLSDMKAEGKVSPKTSSEATDVNFAQMNEEETQTTRRGVVNPSDFNNFRQMANPTKNHVANDAPADEILMKIVIPKEKWKKGALYRVGNCFYADDGEFLYKI